MYENVGKYYFLNNDKKSSETFCLEAMPVKCIYEVVRVRHNKVLYLKDHLLRLKKGLTSRNLDISILINIEAQIKTLVEDHDSFECNIKLDVDKNFVRIYFVKSNYPKLEAYDEGVVTKTLIYDREDPQHKILNMDYKKTIEAIKGSKYFEVILVNDEKIITEGSRSNIVFIHNNKLVGAPLQSILHGITYKNVIKMAKKLGYEMLETGISLEMLNEVEACFLTGTSLGILPIRSIDDFVFDSSNHHIVKSLLKGYNEYID